MEVFMFFSCCRFQVSSLLQPPLVRPLASSQAPSCCASMWTLTSSPEVRRKAALPIKITVIFGRKEDPPFPAAPPHHISSITKTNDPKLQRSVVSTYLLFSLWFELDEVEMSRGSNQSSHSVSEKPAADSTARSNPRVLWDSRCRIC